MAYFENNPVVENQMLKVRKLCFEFTIVGHATPASKTVSYDDGLKGIVAIATQGLEDDADAIEDVSWTTLDDGATNSIFGIVVDGSELGGNIERVMNCYITKSNSALGQTDLINPEEPGATNGNDYLTASGNIAIECDADGVDLETGTHEFYCEITYKIK